MIEVWINSTPVLLGKVTADETGAFTADLELPQGVQAGEHTLTLKGVGDKNVELVTSIGLTVVEKAVDELDDRDKEDSADSGRDLSDIPVIPTVLLLLVLLVLAGFSTVRRRKL